MLYVFSGCGSTAAPVEEIMIVQHHTAGCTDTLITCDRSSSRMWLKCMYCAIEKRKNRLITSFVTSSLIAVCKFGLRPTVYSCTLAKIFHMWYMLLVFTIQKQEGMALPIFSPLKCSFLHVLATNIWFLNVHVTTKPCAFVIRGMVLCYVIFPRGIEPWLIHVSEFLRTRTRVMRGRPSTHLAQLHFQFQV
jgi:hypothetical protein